MGRKMNTREKILYRFEKCRKTLHRVAGYMQEVRDLAQNRSVHISAKTPGLQNAALEMEKLVQETEDCFRAE